MYKYALLEASGWSERLQGHVSKRVAWLQSHTSKHMCPLTYHTHIESNTHTHTHTHTLISSLSWLHMHDRNLSGTASKEFSVELPSANVWLGSTVEVSRNWGFGGWDWQPILTANCSLWKSPSTSWQLFLPLFFGRTSQNWRRIYWLAGAVSLRHLRKRNANP